MKQYTLRDWLEIAALLLFMAVALIDFRAGAVIGIPLVVYGIRKNRKART